MVRSKKVVLITGGAGFLGSHLCDFFLSKGYKVVCMDNLITGSLKNIKQHFKNKDFKFIHHNVSEYIKYPGKVDYVLHFASPASPIDYLNNPIHTLKVGSMGTLNTLGLAKAKKAKYLLASTSEVYGDPQVSPQKEAYWGNVNPVGPRGVYDEAKRFGEAMTMAYNSVHNVNTGIIRIFNTYGPRMRINDGRVVPNFIMQALRRKPLTIYGDGSQTRSFCYVSDLIDGIFRLMRAQEHEPVNVGNPTEVSVKDFARLINKLCDRRPSAIIFKPLPEDDPKRRKPDISRAKKILKWSPRVKLERGLKSTIQYFRSL